MIFVSDHNTHTSVTVAGCHAEAYACGFTILTQRAWNHFVSFFLSLIKADSLHEDHPSLPHSHISCITILTTILTTTLLSTILTFPHPSPLFPAQVSIVQPFLPTSVPTQMSTVQPFLPTSFPLCSTPAHFAEASPLLNQQWVVHLIHVNVNGASSGSYSYERILSLSNLLTVVDKFIVETCCYVVMELIIGLEETLTSNVSTCLKHILCAWKCGSGFCGSWK